MKTRIFAICSIATAIICLLLYLLHNSRPEANPLPQAVVTLTNRQLVEQPAQPQAVENQQTLNTAKTTTVPPTAVASAELSSESNGIDSRLLARWQVPIEFYGKVVDENTNPVAGVNINFNWSELPERGGERTSDVLSDSEGLFSLQGKRGASLTVSFGKKGYYSSLRGQRTFNFTLGPDVISPDPQNPIIFKLKKKVAQEPLMRLTGAMIGPRQYQLDTKGTPTDISFYTGKRTSQGAGQFRVAYWMDVPQDPKQQQFDWHCQVTVPGGGLQMTTEELPFTAPEQGYQESIEIGSNTNAWSDRLEQNFYVHLADGKYGRVKFSLVCGGNPFFGVEALINPSGSKNLEYDKYLPGNIMVDQSAP